MHLAADPLLSQLAPLAIKAGVSLVITGLLSIILWPIRTIRKGWIALKEEQKLIHEELIKQRENCLTTLQKQGDTQIVLLGKTVAALDGVRLDLAEQTGCLRAMTAQPPRRRRTDKK
jgi:hypothetical protein